ncbi:glycoside hydrolase family 44 protein [Streptomyces sp. NPDC049881]|uniref:glycoside hydrolase family 44 protein n=1 Tax=Streptomyces sp. NPDC049881 TaxID=3155778 RepID=UPI00343C5BFD
MRLRTLAVPLVVAGVVATMAPPVAAGAADAGPALSVDATDVRHAISPHVYGMNFASPELAEDLRLPVHRWGGNATTRYNFRNDTTNRASDWYFENIPNDNPAPENLPDGSETDRFVEQNLETGTETVLTLPMLGWVAKERARACGFSVEKYGPQQSTDVWAPDCGNGLTPEGEEITGTDPADTSVAVGPEYVTDWIEHLQSRYGSAAEGGVEFYNLDNEPDLWHHTHRDVRPEGLGYDELRDRTYAYGAAVKAADPDAQTLGPVGWGLNSIFYSGLDQDVCSETNCWSNPPDKAAHGGQDLGPWYLDEMRRYEEEHGTRVLDYFDIHIYPQQSGVFNQEPGSAETQELRLRSTRQLWDPTYVDESWIGQPVRFIPRMRDLVDAHYPGTKLAITEYNWGAHGHINGALAQADVLGIFGREGLDMAALWTAPAADAPVAHAFRMYRNYDGRGGAFGDTSLAATSADQERLAVYAARREADGALTLMVVNKSGEDLTSPVSLTGAAAGTAEVYRYSPADLTGIVREADQPVTGSGFTATFPADSITHLVLPQGGEEPDTEAPTAPGTPVSGTVGADSAELSWPAASDNRGVTGYDVHRVAADGTLTRVGGGTATSHTVTGLEPDTPYTFAVTARDAAGNVSPPSPPLAVRTTGGTGPATCRVAYRVASDWSSGFTGEVRITHTGTAPLDGWELGWDFPAGQRVTQGWSANWSQQGTHVTATALDWNRRLAPGASVTIGFNGSRGAQNPPPTAFTLNGGTCAA